MKAKPKNPVLSIKALDKIARMVGHTSFAEVMTLCRAQAEAVELRRAGKERVQ